MIGGYKVPQIVDIFTQYEEDIEVYFKRILNITISVAKEQEYMKKLMNPVAIRKTSLGLLIATLGLLFISSSDAVAQERYQIQNQKITIEGSGKLKNWKPVVNEIDFSGRFIAHERGLEDLSGFGFGLSLMDSNQSTDKYCSLVHKALLASGNKEIVFHQQNRMVLPIMQTVFISGVVKMIDGNHLSSLSLQYQVEKDQSITVKGKQVIWLYEFGVAPKNLSAYHKDDQITINLEFNLVKEQPVLASNLAK